MPSYVVLMNWTDQGIRNVKETLQRAERSPQLAEKHGASIERIYWTVGPYDLACIVEAPDDESLSAMLLELGTEGNLRTLTMRAYNRDEMTSIIERLG